MYTIVSYDEIWDESHESDVAEQSITVNGCTMQVHPIDSSVGMVSRVISTDPQHFLEPHFQPGSIVPLISDH